MVKGGDMNMLRRWRGILMLCGLVCMVLASCKGSKTGVPETNKLLAGIKLPALPGGVTEARCWSGGGFAKFVNVKFAATPEQGRDYLKACGLPYYYEIDVVGGQANLATTHSLASSNEMPTENVAAEAVSFDGMVTQEWFEAVRQIEHAWFSVVQKAPLHYRLWYDLDAGQFYIYWTYS